jgi:hypothetical protein
MMNTMKKGLGLLMPLFLMACSQQVTISKDTLKDKIAGGWAGKMIGVSYGLPTEFKALGKMYEDSIHWTPVRVKDALWEDDLYVQLTLMDVMDKHGMQAKVNIVVQGFSANHFIAGKQSFCQCIPKVLSGKTCNLYIPKFLSSPFKLCV